MESTKRSMLEPWPPAHVSDNLGRKHLAIERVDPPWFGLNYEVPRIIHGPRNHGMKCSRLDPASQNCLRIGQRVRATTCPAGSGEGANLVSTRQRPSMASLHVLPERLLHKRLPRWAQPFRRHHQRGTGLRERSKCVSCKAPKSMC